MKNEYESPQFDFHRVFFIEDALITSEGEGTGSGGVVVNPPVDPSNPWGDDEW